MFSARKACYMARGFLPNTRKINEAIMEDTRQILISLERRFKCITQQQFIFVTALDRCRKQNFEPTKKISTISQIQYYQNEVADNATDKRIFTMFLSLVHDLAEFRRTLAKVVKVKNDERLDLLFKKWKTILESRQDIASIRASFPNDQVNHLSCDEAKNHFGGIVSLIPVAMDCAREVVERIESTRAYRIETPSNGQNGNKIIHQSRQVKDKELCCRTQDRPHPHFRLTSNSGQESDARNMENGDAVPHGGWVLKPIPRSPALPSPAPSRTSSLTSIVRPSSQNSSRSRPQSQRPHTVTIGNAYTRQASKKPEIYVKSTSRPNTSGKATQTPNYLTSTLRPDLNWPHQSVSEDEMRRLMHSRKHAVARPNWKP